MPASSVLSLHGTVSDLPPDKSISHRAALIAALADGETIIDNFSGGLDNQTTLAALRQLGIDVRQDVVSLDGRPTRRVVIASKGLWSLRPPNAFISCDNSGSTMRMLAGILAAQPFKTTLVGDDSLMKRPMRRVAEPLLQMGATVLLSESGTAPVVIEGMKPLRAISYTPPVASAQVKSLVIFAALHADGVSELIEPIQTRNHTELMLGLDVEKTPFGNRVQIHGGRPIDAKPFSVPSDPSAACFIIALALLARESEVVLKNVCLNPTRTAYLELLDSSGAHLAFENVRVVGGEPIGDVVVARAALSTPLRISGDTLVANVIDEIPMLAVLSAFATGAFELRDAKELRAKESDRIRALVSNFQKLGFRCEEFADGFAITKQHDEPKSLVNIETFGDHRIAMSFYIASLVSAHDIVLSETASIPVSFPNFFDVIGSLQKT